MNKILTGIAGVLLAGGLGLSAAPLASADTPPPVAPGPHHMVWAHGNADINVETDCGPDCFSLVDSSVHDNYRLQPDGRWVAPNGNFIVGNTITNSHGVTANLS